VSNTPPAALVRSVLCTGPPPSPAEVRGQGGRGSGGSVSNSLPAGLVRSVLCIGAPPTLCRGVRAKGQREYGSVSNTPPAALVRSVLCSGTPAPSAEIRGLGGAWGLALYQIRPRLLLTGQCFVAARPLSQQRCEGKGAEGVQLSVKYAPSCSCQVSTL
jgi:hypothetical protein